MHLNSLNKAMQEMENVSIPESLSVQESVEKTLQPELLDYFEEVMEKGDETHVINCIFRIAVIRRALFNGTPSDYYKSTKGSYFCEKYELPYIKVKGHIDELESLYNEYKMTKDYISKFKTIDATKFL